MADADNARNTSNAEQAMLLRTWPRTKTLIGTVAAAGTPVTADLSVVRGRTCFFKAVGGSIFGRVFQLGDTAPVLVALEDFSIATGESEELYVWGDENVRVQIDSDTSGAKLFALHDDTP